MSGEALSPGHEITFLDGPGETTKLAVDLSPLKAIRLKCIDCSGGSRNEVKLCVIPACPLYPFRFGKRPVYEGQAKRKLSDAQKRSLDAMHEARRAAQADSEV